MTPSERLRAARSNAGLSVEQLAERSGRAASTVRASENGQNGLGRKAAEAYAKSLRVSPEWLLFGVGDESTDAPIATRWYRIPVVNHIDDRNWRETDRLYEGELGVGFNIPEGMFEKPEEAYTIASGYAGYRPAEVALVSKIWETGLRADDHLVVRLDKSGFSKITLYAVEFDAEGQHVTKPLIPGSDEKAKRVSGGGISGFQILGVVVGTIHRRRGPAGS